MTVKILLHSYVRDLAGCAETTLQVCEGTTLGSVMTDIFARYPKLATMQRSMLVAVGVEYQPPEYILNEGDEVSFFPPVQGG